jgi:hypothetical protein
MERSKTLRLACWNANEVRGRKLELLHFLTSTVSIFVS